MILDIIKHFESIVKDVSPDAVFECDAAAMLNVKVDTMDRYLKDAAGDVVKGADGRPVSSRFVYVEEPTYAYYGIPSGNLQTHRIPLGIYFCAFEPMQNDAYKGGTPFSQTSPTLARLELRQQLEEEMARPFLAALRHSPLGMQFPGMLETVRVLYPAPRFDANEVSVGLELTVWEHWCLDNYLKPWKWLKHEGD